MSANEKDCNWKSELLITAGAESWSQWDKVNWLKVHVLSVEAGEIKTKRSLPGLQKFLVEIILEKVSSEASHRLYQFKSDQLLENANKFLTHSILEFALAD